MIRLVAAVVAAFSLCMTAPTFAHDTSDASGSDQSVRLEEQTSQDSLQAVIYASIGIILLILVSILIQEGATEPMKRALFWTLAILTIGVTVFLLFLTVRINTVSVTKGPVHWHADFELWACGAKLDLTNPTGFVNKVGTPILHEHNDNRVHVEGPVLRYADVSLERFFEVIGGSVTASQLVVPTDAGKLKYITGEKCPGATAPSALQAFLYQASGSAMIQRKLDDFPHYVLSPHSTVPPGDCVIIEFDQPKTATERICKSYEAALLTGKLIKQ